MNVGKDGCTSSSLVPRISDVYSASSLLMSKCLENPPSYGAEISSFLEGLCKEGDGRCKVINLTLHDLSSLEASGRVRRIYSFFKEPWKMTCSKCKRVVDYRRNKSVRCPVCGGYLRTGAPLLGDKISSEDIIKFIEELSECDSIILFGEEPRVEPIRTLLRSISVFWGKELLLYNVNVLL